MTSAETALQMMRAICLTLPDTSAAHHFGEVCFKVGKKIFVFMGHKSDPTPNVCVKLPESNGQALGLECATPAGYGLGRSGWVVIELAGRDRPSLEVLCDWVEESYRAIAPKKLVKELDDAHED